LNGLLLLIWFIATVRCAESTSGCTEYKVIFYERLEPPLGGQVCTWLTT